MPRLVILLIGFCIVTGSFVMARTSAVHAERATVLLVLEPRKPSGKNWDIGPGADPIICLKKGCYQSRGLNEPARFFSGKSIFFPGIRAGKCRNSHVCVFRDVEISDAGDKIQPVDLDGFEHDRMTKQVVQVDESCSFRKGRVKCRNGLFSPEYSLWVVPEVLAVESGKRALDFALFKGLQDYKQDYIARFLKKERKALPKTVAKFYSVILDEYVPKACTRDADIITSAFHLSGIVKSGQRATRGAVGLFVEKYVDADNLDPILKMVRFRPEVFWALHEAIGTLKSYASAGLVQMSESGEQVRLVPHGKNKSSLLIGWSVKSRARALLDDCLMRRS